MTLRIWISLFVFASHFTAFSTSHAQVDHVRPESSHVISKHDGSKDDIEAIGNRKVGKGRWGNWYSFEKEVALGRQYSNAILHTAKLVDDQRLTEYVDRLGSWAGPIGEKIAGAIEHGYNRSEPYHGYFFKILTGQGPAAHPRQNHRSLPLGPRISFPRSPLLLASTNGRG
jgi:Protein of unknown function (DUF2950)